MVEADAQQRAKALAASGTVDKSLEILNLDLMEEAINRWDGSLSPFPKDGNQTIVVSGDKLVIPAVKK